MFRPKTLALSAATLACAAASLALPAHAQLSRASVDVCRNEQDDARRLSCFDNLARSEAKGERGPIPAWIFDWQTLLAGIGAIGAAYFTIRMTREQITLAEEQEMDRILRRRDAVRATLPLTLMTVLEYTRLSVAELVKIRPTSPAGVIEDANHNFDLPLLPPEMIVGLQSMIDAAPEQDIRDTISDVVERIQVVAARMSSAAYRSHNDATQLMRPRYLITPSSFNDLVLAFAELYTFAASLYDYGRRRATAPVYPSDGVNMYTSLR